jgi:hypothetical protein
MNRDIANQMPEEKFTELADQYQARLPRKFALLLPFKTQIEDLRRKRASFDTIRILLADVGVVVSNDTVFRFCRDVINEAKPRSKRQTRPAQKIDDASRSGRLAPFEEQTFAESRVQRSIIATVKRRGPRIADSKNL